MGKTTTSEQRTVDEIAKELNRSYWTIDGAIRAAGLEPTRRVGTVRLYDTVAVARIERQLAKRTPAPPAIV